MDNHFPIDMDKYERKHEHWVTLLLVFDDENWVTLLLVFYDENCNFFCFNFKRSKLIFSLRISV